MSKLEYLIVKHNGKTIKYMINTQVAPHVQDAAVENILKHYPQDVELDFEFTSDERLADSALLRGLCILSTVEFA